MTSKKNQSVFATIIVMCFIILIGNKCASAQTEEASKKYYTEIIFDNSKIVAEKDRQMITDVFVDYMLLKNTLASGNAADAKVTALTILNVIADYNRSLDPNLLTDSKKLSEDMATLKAKVIQSTTLDEARTNFITLNNIFTDYLKSYGLYNKTIYLYQCDDNPAFGNVQWFSDSMMDTKNPYADQNSGSNCYNMLESWNFN